MLISRDLLVWLECLHSSHIVDHYFYYASLMQLSSRASQNGQRLSQSEKDLSTCKDCSQHGDIEMVVQTVTKTDAQTGLQGTALGREPPRALVAPCRPTQGRSGATGTVSQG